MPPAVAGYYAVLAVLLFFSEVDSQVDLSVSLYAGEFCYVVDHNAGIFLCSRGLKFSLCPNGN